MEHKTLTENPTLKPFLNHLVKTGSLTLAVLSGSRSYGTARIDSDLDVRGIYLAPLNTKLGVSEPPEQFTSSDPDVVVYELGKFAKLAINSNPVALETLFCEDVLVTSEAGEELRRNANVFFSQTARSRYAGYANAQIAEARKLLLGEKTNRSFTDKHVQKTLRHTYRLLDQGYQFITTGELDVKVKDPQQLQAKAEQPLEKILQDVEEGIERIKTADSPLPDRPDLEAVNKLLVHIRRTYS